MFSELGEFFKLHGHCNVPADWQANPELARWVYHQRAAKQRNNLTADQVRQMDEIGFAWNTNDGEWETMFAKLVEHLRPMHNEKPRDRVMDAQLRRWIVTQRQFKKNGELDAAREQKLNGIGFEWQPLSKQWLQMFELLSQYHSDHGHCRVPAKWAKNPKLASWVAVQRARKPAGKLSAKRVAALDSLGFSWSGRASSGKAWEAMFATLKQFRQENGHANVPQKYAANRKLGWWVSIQRRDRRKGKLDSQQTAQLDGIGFNWSPQSGGTPPDDAGWKAMLAALQAFKSEHGHCRVPGQWSWVRNQRAAKRYKRPIMAERAKRLDELGFVWTLIEPMSWEIMFATLVEFKKVHGHCNVPQKSRQHISVEQKRLGKWVNTQRTHYKRSTLRHDRKQQLDSIGFVWNLRPNLAPAR
jgi:hypothetical protein